MIQKIDNNVKLNWLKKQLLISKCPDFLESMPKQESGIFQGIGYATSSMGDMKFTTGEKFNNIQDAYIDARKIALEIENHFRKETSGTFSIYDDGSYPNSIGICWSIKDVLKNKRLDFKDFKQLINS